uniref:Uncharacterized protein n=1 Tax=Romanomermis culicivorax TaxID=13658 RepID=A0A915JHV3_ROMCU
MFVIVDAKHKAIGGCFVVLSPRGRRGPNKLNNSDFLMLDRSKKPLLQVTNLEFYAGLMSLAFWSMFILATFALHPLAPLFIEILAASLLVLTSTWMYRGRHHFGRLEARGHFDEVGLMELGPRSGDVLLWDPPTVIEHTKEI